MAVLPCWAKVVIADGALHGEVRLPFFWAVSIKKTAAVETLAQDLWLSSYDLQPWNPRTTREREMSQSVVAALRQLPLEQRIAMLQAIRQPGRTASALERLSMRQIMASIDGAEYDQILRAQVLEAAVKGRSTGLEWWHRPAIALGKARQALPNAQLEWFTLKNTGLISKFVRNIRKYLAQWASSYTLKVTYEDIIQRMLMGLSMSNEPYAAGPVAAITGVKAAKVIANGTYVPLDIAGYLSNYGFNRVQDEITMLDKARGKNVDEEGADILDNRSKGMWVSRDPDTVNRLLSVIEDRGSEAYQFLIARFQRAFRGDQKWAQVALDYLTRTLNGEDFKDGEFARSWGMAHGGFSRIKQERIIPFLENLQKDEAFLEELERLSEVVPADPSI